MHEKRKEFRLQKQCFELYRNRFYRKVNNKVSNGKHDVTNEQIKEFWNSMWEANGKTDNKYYKEFVEEYFTDINNNDIMFLSFK